MEQISNWAKQDELAGLDVMGREIQLKTGAESVDDWGISERLIAVLEAERGKIAREIHDEAGQLLISATFLLDQALAMLPQGFVARTLVVQARQTLDECAEELHRLAFNLRPRMLEDLGLLPALRSCLRQYANVGSLSVEAQLEQPPRGLSSSVELAIFRIVQESLANVRKHARASSVRVRLCFKNCNVELEISDDGVGFDLLTVGDRDGLRPSLGMRGMKERATALGGELEIISAPSAGTTICATLPLRSEQDDR